MKDFESFEISLAVHNPVKEAIPVKKENSSERVSKTDQAKKAEMQKSGEQQENSGRKEVENYGENMVDLLDKLQEYVQSFNTKLSFSYDKESQKPIIYVIDKETDEVIRQIPPKEMLKLISNLEQIRGIIFQGKA